MSNILKSNLTFSLVAAIAFLFTGCGESKVAQCNKLINIANQASTLGQQYSKDPKAAKGPQALVDFSKKIDEISTQIKAVEIKDEKLQGFQGRFLKLYEDISSNLNNASTAISKKNIKDVNRYLVNLQKSKTEEGAIVQEINSYCSGK